MTASRYAQGVATTRDPAVPVTAVPVTSVLGDRGHWDGWGDGPVPPPRPPEWTRPTAEWPGPNSSGPNWSGPDWSTAPVRERYPDWGPPPPGRHSAVRRGGRALRWIVGVVMLVGLAGTVSVAGLVAMLEARSGTPQPRPTPTAARPGAVVAAPPGDALTATTEPSAAPSVTLDTATIVKSVNRSVVNITSTLGLRNARAAGTGVLLSNTGLVLTNNHVIAGATAISGVTVANGRSFTATVVGYDRSHDIAVIQLGNAAGLTRLAVADSAKVQVGDDIVAVGNAGGQGGESVTGTVTGLNRTITAQDPEGGSSQRLTGLIQVAAAIKPGDSGGPLVDRTGRLIGINTAASTDTGDAVGFAIPSNAALAIAQRITAGEASDTVHIGATALLGVNAKDADGRGGAEVTGVLGDSPAARAGIAEGDVIRSLDDRDVAGAAGLTTLIDARKPGDTVRVTWIDRTGRSRTASIRLATGPAG
ncbi:S1C family serine protease [Dactylosporangium matsuzakiense]|uniref:Serine protease n=1 Tax=Dactylosporangium matsuzakiense TaxID=53360 RepID=A0A9W6NST4_9ACTN|nr:trypsin-like peptidase domain-containing protein [Dactylosporangium matsuzakiense]UWZ47861.1 trypsin-like peptidase domain-containing protein [Dactylosporangium matsuzakiense]GLL07964.1 serine protease [Dactylosporangium matsuzakiense]